MPLRRHRLLTLALACCVVAVASAVVTVAGRWADSPPADRGTDARLELARGHDQPDPPAVRLPGGAAASPLVSTREGTVAPAPASATAAERPEAGSPLTARTRIPPVRLPVRILFGNWRN